MHLQKNKDNCLASLFPALINCVLYYTHKSLCGLNIPTKWFWKELDHFFLEFQSKCDGFSCVTWIWEKTIGMCHMLWNAAMTLECCHDSGVLP